MSEATATVTRLGERQDQLIDRANATIDRASDQLLKTDAITASMDEVTANMAELTGRVSALAPLARMIGASASSPVAKVAAFAYGVNRAVGMRRSPARGGHARPAAARAKALPPAAAPGWRQPALNGRHDEAAS
jgi:hypothetical protein